jgi:hypothetical protein
MKRNLVRYKVKPEQADENARLIKDVFTELHARKPDGVRYMSLRLADGAFIHFSISDGDASPIQKLEAFQRFQSGIKERTLDAPTFSDVTIVGNYRMLSD